MSNLLTKQKRVPRKKKKFLATKKAGIFKISLAGIKKLPIVKLKCKIESLETHGVSTEYIQQKDTKNVRLFEKDVYWALGEMVSYVLIPQSGLPLGLKDSFYRCAIPTNWLVLNE